MGLLSEDIAPKTRVLWGNFPQIYSHVGLIQTAFVLDAMPADVDIAQPQFPHALAPQIIA